jgi:hypothetical protein
MVSNSTREKKLMSMSAILSSRMSRLDPLLIPALRLHTEVAVKKENLDIRKFKQNPSNRYGVMRCF